MNKGVVTYIFSILLLGNSASVFSTEITIESSLALFDKAFRHADTVQLEKMLANNYQHTNSGNKPIGKTQWLKWVSGRSRDIKNNTLKYSNYSTIDLVIQNYENFAVVTGRNIADGIDHGKEFKIDIRFTHVWIKELKSWKRLSFHDAPTK